MSTAKGRLASRVRTRRKAIISAARPCRLACRGSRSKADPVSVARSQLSPGPIPTLDPEELNGR